MGEGEGMSKTTVTMSIKQADDSQTCKDIEKRFGVKLIGYKPRMTQVSFSPRAIRIIPIRNAYYIKAGVIKEVR